MRLPLRAQKLILSAAAATCLTAAVAVVAWGVRLPDASPEPNLTKDNHKDSANKSSLEQVQGPSREDFAQLWDRPLRCALYDPPPPKPEVKELPPLGVELLGTILEPENSMAIVRSEQGNIEYKREGDSVGPADSPARLVEIHGDTVVFERTGQRVTLKVRGRELR